VLALALFLLVQPHELIEAVRAGSLETSYALLAAGADPNSTDGVGETALIYASFDNRAEIAKILLAFKANVHTTWGGSTALDFAVSRGSLKTAQLLIDSGADVRRVYPSGRTPLHIAVRAHRTAIAALLIDRGADVDASDTFGFTPLLEAIQKRFDDLVVLLLEAGADPLLKNKAGVSPIAAAASMHRAALTRELLARVNNPPVELLSESVRRNLPDIVDTLLASGMNPSAALHEAALQGRTKFLKTLIEHGADVNHKTATGATPLHDAAIRGNVEAAQILLENGADVNARETESGDTPLYMAAAMGREEVAVLLLARGANPEIPSNEGGTPLHAAITNGFDRIADAIRAHPVR
jgi:cytohesin